MDELTSSYLKSTLDVTPPRIDLDRFVSKSLEFMEKFPTENSRLHNLKEVCKFFCSLYEYFYIIAINSEYQLPISFNNR